MRRGWLAASLPALSSLPVPWLAGCSAHDTPRYDGGWIGAGPLRGHVLHEPAPAWPAGAPVRRAAVLVLGGGMAGLAAARAFTRAGVDDLHLLELEDQPGGNARGHAMGGMGCPLGAHYLPQPGAAAHEVLEWLHELGLLRQEAGRTVADERHLCHAPQERLFIDGEWHDGLLPPADPWSATTAQYRRFAQAVAASPPATIPAHRTPWTAAHQALDEQPFARWLDAQGLTDAKLRWYLDYCCRDDYGAGAAAVSARAGLHYFASRHGFHPPGDSEGEREPVFTWPEGNAWLARRLAAGLGERLHTGALVLRVREQRHAVEVLLRRGDQLERWEAGTVVLALPLFVAARVLENPPEALRQAAAATTYAPWLVANLQLDAPLLDRPGAPRSWDNVAYGSAALGYVDAMHQSLRPVAGPTVLTWYTALPPAERLGLRDQPWRVWAARVVAELSSLHPDLPWRLRRVDLTRHGHAMAIPLPGQHASASARAALRGGGGRVRFAHADLAGYSVLEEAFTAGCEAAQAAPRSAGIVGPARSAT